MKKLLSILAAMLAVVVLVACTARDSENPPELSVDYAGASYQIAQGEVNWYAGGKGTVREAKNPLNPEYGWQIISAKGNETKIQLSFSEKPDELIINRWDSGEIGQEDASPEETLNGQYELLLPDNGQAYVFQVLAKWKNGKVSYAFVLDRDGKVQPEDDPDLNPEPKITLQAKPDVLYVGEEQLELVVKNRSKVDMTCTPAYRLEKQEGITWKDVPFKPEVAFNEDNINIPAKNDKNIIVPLKGMFPTELGKGHYRIVKQIDGGDYTCEFDIE